MVWKIYYLWSYCRSGLAFCVPLKPLIIIFLELGEYQNNKMETCIKVYYERYYIYTLSPCIKIFFILLVSVPCGVVLMGYHKGH